MQFMPPSKALFMSPFSERRDISRTKLLPLNALRGKSFRQRTQCYSIFVAPVKETLWESCGISAERQLGSFDPRQLIKVQIFALHLDWTRSFTWYSYFVVRKYVIVRASYLHNAWRGFDNGRFTRAQLADIFHSLPSYLGAKLKKKHRDASPIFGCA